MFEDRWTVHYRTLWSRPKYHRRLWWGRDSAVFWRGVTVGAAARVTGLSSEVPGAKLVVGPPSWVCEVAEIGRMSFHLWSPGVILCEILICVTKEIFEIPSRLN